MSLTRADSTMTETSPQDSRIPILPSEGVFMICAHPAAERFAEAFRQAWRGLGDDRGVLLRLWEKMRREDAHPYVPDIRVHDEGSWLVEYGSVVTDEEGMHEGEDLYDITFYRQKDTSGAHFWASLLERMPDAVVQTVICCFLAETLLRAESPESGDAPWSVQDKAAAWGADLGALRTWCEEQRDLLQDLVHAELDKRRNGDA